MNKNERSTGGMRILYGIENKLELYIGKKRVGARALFYEWLWLLILLIMAQSRWIPCIQKSNRTQRWRTKSNNFNEFFILCKMNGEKKHITNDWALNLILVQTVYGKWNIRERRKKIKYKERYYVYVQLMNKIYEYELEEQKKAGKKRSVTRARWRLIWFLCSFVRFLVRFFSLSDCFTISVRQLIRNEKKKDKVKWSN